RLRALDASPTRRSSDRWLHHRFPVLLGQSLINILARVSACVNNFLTDLGVGVRSLVPLDAVPVQLLSESGVFPSLDDGFLVFQVDRKSTRLNSSHVKRS